MLHPAFKTDPYWWDEAPPETTPSGEALPASAEVAIIGSGYCGLSAAAEFGRHGVESIVLDAGPLGIGASTRSTGGVTGGQKILLAGPSRNVGAEQLARMLEDTIASFAYVTDLIGSERLDADFQRCGRFLAAYSEAHYRRLLRLGGLLRQHTGVTVRDVPRDQVGEIIATDFYRGGILVEDYGSLHPAKYHRALRQLARRRGARLFSHTPVDSISSLGGRHILRTPRGEISAGQVVVATNGYGTTTLPFFRKRLIPVASYHIATEPLPRERIERLLPGSRMVSDSQRNLVAMRPSSDGTRILFGARPAAFDPTEEVAAPLIRRAMLRIWPGLADVAISHCWKGTVAMTFDRKPHLGEVDGLHYAVGCNASGVAMMSYLGCEVARRVLGRQQRPSAFDTPHFPTRRWYKGRAWFVPLITEWYDLRDAMDRLRG